MLVSTTDCTMTKQHHHKKHHKDHHHHDSDHDKDHDHHHRKHRKKTITNPIIRAVLQGVYEDECVLAQLRGCPHLLAVIWRDVRSHCLAQIRTPNKNKNPDRMRNDHDSEEEEGEGVKGIIQSYHLMYYEGLQ